MAKIVQDIGSESASDDEFPSVQELVATRGDRKRAQASKSSRVRVGDDEKRETKVRSPMKKNLRKEEVMKVVEEAREGEVPKAKARKRVLNQKSDNPLLRPFDCASSELLGEGSRRKGKVLVSETTLPAVMKSIESEDEDANQARKTARGKIVRKTAEKTRATPPLKVESEEEDFGLDSDGLSDFIVDDSTFLEEEDTVIEEPAPRSVRRLVKGRKSNRVQVSDDEGLDLRMGKLKVEDDASKTKTKKCPKGIQFKIPRQSKNDEAAPASSDFEDPFTLRYSPSMNKPINVPKETRFATPPGSPELKPKGLVSPKKKIPRIPSTPHRPSMDGFWQQDIVNDWNDEYSPRKVICPQPYFNADGSVPIDPVLSPRKSPVKQDRITKEAKKSFAQTKHALAEAFLLELDTKVTNGEISRLAGTTGGVKIIWSKKLNSTAGRANWKRETMKSNFNPQLPHYRHHASIELAEKVIDEENRLLNTIAHEFCHLTTFMIDNMKTNPHGKEFKAWGAKVTRMFGHRGIEVTTKHSYEIDYKYVWECENCGMQFKRHSKSIDPERQRCGTCKSRLFQTKPVPRVGKENGGKEKGLGEYQMFVKENMSRVKQENPGSPQKDIMSLVGKKYQEYKASKLNEAMTAVEMVDIMAYVESRQITPEQERADFVSRKLNFLDLTRE
ncbi:SprT-like family-domain-containing protein [Hyaloscypha finlandica]|nr:SprT-like family-domain-containing protein [Hyaloscypha finlandica]